MNSSPRANPKAATRRSLIGRLKDWADDRSWQEFFDIYWKLIYRLAARSGLKDPEAQDVVQEVVIAVARRMPQFRYDPAIGSFKSWLLLITRRKINDHLRRFYRESRLLRPRAATDSGTTAWERVPNQAGDDLEAHWETEWTRNLIDAALQKVKQQVDPLQFQIFDCYALKQWPVSDVVRTLGVTENQVYLAKSRLTALIRQECQRLQNEML